MKAIVHALTAIVAAGALSACCYRPCPRPMPPVAPSYCAPPCAPVAVVPQVMPRAAGPGVRHYAVAKESQEYAAHSIAKKAAVPDEVADK